MNAGTDSRYAVSAAIWAKVSPGAWSSPKNTLAPSIPSSPTVAISAVAPSCVTLVIEHARRRKIHVADRVALLVQHLPEFQPYGPKGGHCVCVRVASSRIFG
jgi:hypothetical protein